MKMSRLFIVENSLTSQHFHLPLSKPMNLDSIVDLTMEVCFADFQDTALFF